MGHKRRPRLNAKIIEREDQPEDSLTKAIRLAANTIRESKEIGKKVEEKGRSFPTRLPLSSEEDHGLTDLVLLGKLAQECAYLTKSSDGDGRVEPEEFVSLILDAKLSYAKTVAAQGGVVLIHPSTVGATLDEAESHLAIPNQTADVFRVNRPIDELTLSDSWASLATFLLNYMNDNGLNNATQQRSLKLLRHSVEAAMTPKKRLSPLARRQKSGESLLERIDAVLETGASWMSQRVRAIVANRIAVLFDQETLLQDPHDVLKKRRKKRATGRSN